MNDFLTNSENLAVAEFAAAELAAAGLLAELGKISRDAAYKTRIINENLLMAKAFQRPILGWGGYSRNFVADATGRLITIADGYWIITLGTLGLVFGALTEHPVSLAMLLRWGGLRRGRISG